MSGCEGWGCVPKGVGVRDEVSETVVRDQGVGIVRGDGERV